MDRYYKQDTSASALDVGGPVALQGITESHHKGVQLSPTIEEYSFGLPSDQPIQSTVSIERNEFLEILYSCEPAIEKNTLGQTVDHGMRSIAPILREAAIPPAVKMICPWYGGPSVEVTFKSMCP
ncbi:hypothetical protein DTO013E5_1082 [Penicillium roqueforti]|uniref:uncharacterized protein n=1 Tax=Penicillium roqueforti TaxID=5082 RepID=UPI00190A1C20|nr:uncharacterized protein LCP9604111_1891 [Penicillium roqueforti]KAF9251895.1 hypothetical protein LCP9604111_1891 [Penicillium roqueforti]KAI1836291.1 hypothetical protein CBS147337_2518 [Penicillium roqueforti]KAI2690050.1 hypothetical protein CBS147355_501 [Penicillium roqueforti]KAI2702568.1 hypothetical protein CBS147372_4301 [Penicillium roqueforti]KAI2729464.1 hypothetical protein CBS147354_849 [Penicillium roqueforti]